MIPVAALTKFFWYGSIVLEILVCSRLFRSGLWRRYDWFTVFVATLCGESVLLAIVRPISGALYGEAWIVTRGLALLLETAAVIEIFSLFAENFPGIETFGRKLFIGLTTLSLVVVAATLPGDAMRGGWILAYQMTSVANRAIHLLCASFLVFMLIFFARFGGPVAATLRRHAWCMTCFLGATALAYWPLTISRNLVLSEVLFPAVTSLCLVGWLFALQVKGEQRARASATPAEMAEYEAAEALSERLLRFGERITLRGLLGLK